MHLILMSRDIPVAKICIYENFQKASLSEIYCENYLPLHVQYAEEEVQNEVFEHWFWHRCIPNAREGLEDFLKHTDCANTHELALRDRALAITDHYWVKKEGESVKWDDINLYKNGYSQEIGNIIFGTEKGMITEIISPDLTTNGWLRKAWRRHDDGKDYLYKMGSFPYFQEPLNEVFCSELAKKFCSLDFVEYNLCKVNGNYCSICESFTKEGFEFVPAFSIYQTAERPIYVEPYEFLVEQCKNFGIAHAKEEIGAMMTFDYLISNTDRHMGNFGFIRDIKTLEFKGMAPLFDNGTSLWTENEQVLKNVRDPAEPFKCWQEEQIKLLKKFDNIDIKSVKDMSERLFELLSNSGMDLDRVDEICRNYDDRWGKLNHIIEHNFEKKLYKNKAFNDLEL